MMNKRNHKKAFTIMELLIAVAIIVVLLAVSMPAVSSLASDLKMKELDSYARTIYIEAQNQLITKRAEGGLESLQLLMENTYGDHNLSAKPQDFADGDSSWSQLYYLNASDPLLSDLIPAGAGFDGSFLIELNPQTGVVYSVFYQEAEDAIDYTTIQSLANRSKAERVENELGYFGGDVETVAQVDFDLGQQIEVVNEEELYVVISYRLSSEFARNYRTGLTTTLTLTGKTSGKNVTFTINNDNMITNGGRMEKRFLLDSLLSGYSFKDIAGSDLIPGEDLEIKVESTYVSGAINKTETSSTVTNSLFASNNGTQITISSLRHLRNLDGTVYTHSGTTPEIIMGSDIDFATTNFDWEINASGCVYTGRGTNPLANFTPLDNDSVFKASGASFKGNGHSLKNFVIDIDTAEDNVGIIKAIAGMNISDVKVLDILVEAPTGTKVGTLAGSITGGTVKNCGVYLSDNSPNGGYYSDNTYSAGVYANEMEKRYYTYTITGGETTGGLCGYAKNVAFTNSFAAIMVNGSTITGGLCGAAEGGSFENCYASGDVTATSQVGGLIGTVTNAAFDGCYTSNEISATGQAGGFVAISTGSTYTNCTSYAGLTSATGQGVPEKTSTGVFIGSTNTSGDTFTNCVYLKQDGRNAGLTDTEGVAHKYWTELVVSNAVSKCHPYSSALTRTAFPFTMVTGSHYGNWPSQFTIDTSLVYYEVYSDNTYGYYCVTTISGGGTGSSFTWVLDTLKDEICVEDGYALLTIYNLESFDYLLNIGSVVESDANYAENTSTGSLTVANEHGTGKAKLLRQQSTLTFKGYEGTFTPETDFSTKTVKNMFSVTGMYLYQLPYELQVTNRANVNKFYDRLTIYNGLAKNNVLGPVIGGDEVTDAGALTFYYCPHFAKNAINPGLWNGMEKPENPVKVSVRSARQLNALGRYVYYWNTHFGYTDKINFVQENDISFSDYVTTYCGQTFNLMDTSASNPVRNRAIGQSKVTTEKQFNNSYNGNFKKIIDYRLETDQQFAGFFGEVENGVIENIVMTVSEPYDPSNPNSKGGYIHGTYCGSYPDDVFRLASTAVGGIVGLSYKTNNIIRNCAISGYEVKYISHVTSADIYDTNVTNVAVGGLVGNSMSQIENCSAVCDVRVEINGELFWESWRGGSVTMGGLAGTSYYKEVKSCYSGGTIDISVSDDAYIAKINNLAAGGIAGAVLKTFHDEDINPNATTDYKDLYTYTRILIGSKFDTCNCYFAPIMPNVVLYPTWHHNREPKNPVVVLTNCKYLDTAFNGAQDEGEDSAERTPTGIYGATAVEYGDLQAAFFAGMGYVNDAAHTFPVSSTLAGKVYNLPATVKDGLGQYVHYGDWPHKVVPITLSKVYPGYFEIYEDGTVGSYYVDHRGNICSTLRNDLDIIDAGYANMSIEPPADPTAVLNTVTLAGITYYVYEDETIDDRYQDDCPWDQKLKTEQSTTMTVDYEVINIIDGEIVGDPTIVTMELYVNPNFGASISKESDLGQVADNPLQVRTEEQLLNLNKIYEIWDRSSMIYIKQTKNLDLSDLSESIKIQPNCDYDGGKEEGFQMLNAPMTVFSQVNGFLHDAWSVGGFDTFIQGTSDWTVIDDCLVEEATVAESVDTAIFAAFNQGTITNSYVKNSSCNAIGQNGAGFVNYNYGSGVIENCGIYSDTDYSATTISGNQAVGFTFTNAGVIRNCFSNCTLSTSNYTAGFIQTNTAWGVIENCYANCQGYAMATGGNAFGFMMVNQGTIKNCYSAGLAKSINTTADKFVYGFGANQGTIINSYSVCELVSLGTTVFGFTDGGTVTNCYWGYSDILNVDIDGSNSLGTKITLKELSEMEAIGTAVEGETAVPLADNGVTDLPYDNTLGSDYPYPGIVGVAHRGDWPKALGISNRNSMVKPSHKYAGLFYYEKYTDGTYGLYVEGYNEDASHRGFPESATVVVNTLADATLAVDGNNYGIGVFYSEGCEVAKWFVRRDGTDIAISTVGESLSLDLSGYCFRLINKAGTELSEELWFYFQIPEGNISDKIHTLTKATADATRPAPIE